MNPWSRRQTLVGVGSSLFIMSLGDSALAQSDNAVIKLKGFFVQTVGKSNVDRRSIAEQALKGINSLNEGTLLVEIAAIGVLVRTGSTSEAVRKGYTRTSKSAVDLAASKFGNVAWANALIGAWHYEVCRRSSVGATLMGASKKEGDQFYSRAKKLDPTDGGIRLAHAVSLLGDDGRKHAQSALAMLRGNDAVRGNAYSKLVAERSAALETLLASGKTVEAEQLALKIF